MPPQKFPLAPPKTLLLLYECCRMIPGRGATNHRYLLSDSKTPRHHCSVRCGPLFETSVDLPVIPAACSELQRPPVSTRSEVFKSIPRTYSNHSLRNFPESRSSHRCRGADCSRQTRCGQLVEIQGHSLSAPCAKAAEVLRTLKDG